MTERDESQYRLLIRDMPAKERPTRETEGLRRLLLEQC